MHLQQHCAGEGQQGKSALRHRGRWPVNDWCMLAGLLSCQPMGTSPGQPASTAQQLCAQLEMWNDPLGASRSLWQPCLDKPGSTGQHTQQQHTVRVAASSLSAQTDLGELLVPDLPPAASPCGP